MHPQASHRSSSHTVPPKITVARHTRPAPQQALVKAKDTDDLNEDIWAEPEAKHKRGNEADLERENGHIVASALDASDVAEQLPHVLGTIPSYAITDQSRIDISVAQHQLQESMGTQSF